MTTTISDGTITVTPTVIDGYNSTRESTTLAHEVPGSAWPDIVLRPAGPQRGTLRLGFAGSGSEVASLIAQQLHASGSVLALASTDRSTVAMSYVLAPGGRVTRELDDTTRDAWIVTADFLEVQP